MVEHLNREAGAVLRYRTCDLSVLDEGTSPHVDGSTIRMPKGIFGRTDEMHKVRGVKVYPKGVPLVLAGFPNLDPMNYQLSISRPKNTVNLTVTVVGVAPEDDLWDGLTEQLQIRLNRIGFVDELDEGSTVVDERY
jgi:phenylacetate-CoA ligase